MQNGRVAIPSIEAGGLDGQRSGHFGHCDVFTLVDVQDGDVKNVTTISNEGHAQGGCMAAVNLLAGHKVKALIVGGIGMRPLSGFRQAGIDVFHDAVEPGIRPVLEALVDGRLPMISDDQACSGGHHGSQGCQGVIELL